MKAVKYWKTPEGHYLYENRKEAGYFSGFDAPKVAPVALVPMDEASVDEMIAQISTAIWQYERNQVQTYGGLSRAALAAIGIKGGAK